MRSLLSCIMSQYWAGRQKVWSWLRSSDQCKYLMITSLQRPDVGLPLLKWFRQVPHFIQRNKTLLENVFLFSFAHISVSREALSRNIVDSSIYCTHTERSRARARCPCRCRCRPSSPGPGTAAPSAPCNNTVNILSISTSATTTTASLRDCLPHLKYWPHLALPASFFSRFSFALLQNKYFVNSFLIEIILFPIGTHIFYFLSILLFKAID